MHLEANGTRPGLALTLPGGVLTQVGKVLFTDAFERKMPVQFLIAAGVYMNLEVHFGFAMQTFEIALELALVGSDGLAESFIVLKDSSKTER